MRTCGGYGFTKANGNMWFRVKCKLEKRFSKQKKKKKK